MPPSPPGAPSSDVEVEWQFDALDLRPVERWLAAPPVPPATVLGPVASANGAVVVEPRPVKRLVDTYVDTEDWRIGRSGFVARVRQRARAVAVRATGGTSGHRAAAATGPGVGGGEVTLKDRTQAVGGLRRRLEVTEALPDKGLPGLGADGPVGRRLHALVGSRHLDELFEVRTRRRPYALVVGGDEVGEIALDDTVIGVHDSPQPLRMRRVEIEVHPDWVDTLAPLVERLRQDCGLQPATLSKFEAGLLGSGLQVPAGPDLGPTALSPVPTVAEVGFVVLRRNLALMLAHEAGTRLGEDPEDLHDMRVATRRMRAALALFVDVLPARMRHVRTELGWVADCLGTVRDLDVQLERVHGWMDGASDDDRAALKDLAELLGRRRQGARTTLLACFESARYERLVTTFTTMLRQGPARRAGPAHAPAMLAAPDLVRTRHRAVSKAAKRARHSGHPEDYHRVRIRAKRLRYTLEFFSELYPGQTSKYVRRVVKLQDTLGSLQDARVAADQLRSLATDDTEGLTRSTVFAMGGVAERYRHESAGLAADVPDRLAAVEGKRWRRLIDHIDRRRLEMTPLYGWPGALGPQMAPPGTPRPAAEPSSPATGPNAPAAEVAPSTGHPSQVAPVAPSAPLPSTTRPHHESNGGPPAVDRPSPH
ncbi:MAG TPA: CHAD domain-containing protein [Acidimicrobiales bacterium]|nr:CHAD domain-containing protein [Acidimicrobiales bacterium]